MNILINKKYILIEKESKKLKKIFVLFASILLLMGCGKKSNIDVAKEFTNKLDKVKSYKIAGNLEIQNDEEIFKYSINVNDLEKSY